ncbi:hypothetical protein PV325_009148 [Microctonus aethiopoides]|nr:hypothetical protein PV325_009148 [Microctonus aethiopoides]KAK0098719.1 hypothetical protein PV326_004873 [Microctonus aethiopoides]
MAQLGEFTMYQDPKATAAAVYFHHRRQFDGIIDYRYLIQGLDIDFIDVTVVNEFQVGESAVVVRKKSIGHETKKELKSEDEKIAKTLENGNEEVKSEVSLNHGYPEILVIVSCELAQELMKTASDSEKYTAIVSYVLTLFNGADMLYSKLKHIKIELNIAGIIIVPGCDSFAFLKKCQNQIHNKENIVSMLDADCTNSILYKYLVARKKTIPTDSYDVVVYLTGKDLYDMDEVEKNSDKKEGEIKYVKGLADACDNLYECRQSGVTVILVATVNDRGNLENYAAIAHEVAHLMTVRHDNSLSNENEKCYEHIMKISEGESWCKTCLSWSDVSEEKSPNCCSFINEPRSLYPSRPRQMLTANEQCQCYGYDSEMAFKTKQMNSCNSNMICRGGTEMFNKAPIPMDGTPCGPDRVCWNKECVSLIQE